MNSTVDEAQYTPEIIKDYNFTHDYYEAWRDTVLHSMKTMGMPYQYQQTFTASYNVPFNRFKSLDWITANGSYNATYNWNRMVTRNQQTPSGGEGEEKQANLGNTISSLQSWQVDGALNFENLYNKSKYLKDINQRYNGRPQRSRFRPKTYTQTISLKADSTVEITHRCGSEKLTIVVTDRNGKKAVISMTMKQ